MFQKKDPAELLRVTLNQGLLLDSTELAVRYIAAVMGEGPEEFGLKNCLHATKPAVWLPHNTIDHLMLELECWTSDPLYAKVNNSTAESWYYKYIDF